jgi:uncharacterized membrane protein
MTTITEVTAKPDEPATAATPPESDSERAQRGFDRALSNASDINVDAVTDAIGALGEASSHLEELGLDWGELADLIVELEGAMEVVNGVENQVNALLARERDS